MDNNQGENMPADEKIAKNIKKREVMKKVSKDAVVYSMSASNKPILYVEPGDTIQFETWDALHGQVLDASKGITGLDWDRVNPATGPVYVNGAEEGDILSVYIKKIEVEETGVVLCGAGMGVLGYTFENVTTKRVPIKNDFVYYSDDIHLPLNKMIGVIGVAPKYGEISCGVPDYHGGNMDCKEIKESATVLLPVFVPGALLALGDLHAVMADGEVSVTGVEVGGLVTVTVDLIKNKDYPLPMIINDSFVMTLASDEDLDVAVEMAVFNMVEYLTKVKGFSKEDAVMLISLIADVRICQVVDAKRTARVEFPKKFL